MIKERDNEYVNRMVGLPWLKGSDDPANGGLDCWGRSGSQLPMY